MTKLTEAMEQLEAYHRTMAYRVLDLRRAHANLMEDVESHTEEDTGKVDTTCSCVRDSLMTFAEVAVSGREDFYRLGVPRHAAIDQWTAEEIVKVGLERLAKIGDPESPAGTGLNTFEHFLQIQLMALGMTSKQREAQCVEALVAISDELVPPPQQNGRSVGIAVHSVEELMEVLTAIGAPEGVKETLRAEIEKDGVPPSKLN